MKERCGRAERFCGKYLQCMDPDQAAAAAGCGDGYAMLETKLVQRRLERLREAAAGQVRREDAVRRLAQLAFGQVNSYYRYFFSVSTLSSLSQGRSRSLRPKWPYAAVCL